MKAIKEVAKEQILKIKLNEANVGHILHGESKRINGSLFSDLLSFAEVLLTEAQRWIPVEEELPEDCDFLRREKKNDLGFILTDEVLIKTVSDGLKITKRVFVKGKWIWPAGYDVVSWRPIDRK